MRLPFAVSTTSRRRPWLFSVSPSFKQRMPCRGACMVIGRIGTAAIRLDDLLTDELNPND